MECDKLDTNVRKTRGVRPRGHEKERSGRAGLMGMAKRGLDVGGVGREGGFEVVDEGFVGEQGTKSWYGDGYRWHDGGGVGGRGIDLVLLSRHGNGLDLNEIKGNGMD